jgi:2',3'-cyclic-nucleotide 2'-phosphodiesterase (5'-nucleotidase family)
VFQKLKISSCSLWLMTTLLSVFLLFSCKDTYKVIESSSSNETVKSDLSTPDSLLMLVNPYKNQLEKSMNEVLAISDVSMEIGCPEGLLGSFVADLVLEESRKKFGGSVDLCVLNNGGLRTPIMKGEVTRGMVFELMPFENELVVIKMKGDSVASLINYIANRSMDASSVKLGVPISGMRIRIGGGEISEVRVGVQKFNIDSIYAVVTSDYLASGGDNMVFFSGEIESSSLGVKLRDVIMNKVIEMGKMGNHIRAELDGRVYVAE